LTSAFSSLY